MAPDPALDPLDAEPEPVVPKKIVTAEDLERLADEAADLDGIVRRELAHLAHEPVSIRNLPTAVEPVRRRWPGRALVALSVLAMIAIVVSNLRATQVEPVTRPVLPEAPPSAAATSPPPTPATPVTSLSVGLSFSAPCWVLARADGRTVLRGTFHGGVQRVHARNEVRLTLGNAGGVTLTVNGKPVGTGGGSGDVVHLTLVLRNGAVTVAR